jgi:AhpD family alkylhydroperoxidase
LARTITGGNMTATAIQTIEDAPARSQPLLRALKEQVGMVPNLAAAMAASPSLLEGFLAIRDIYGKASFSGAEIQVLSLTAAYENDCGWCVAFHTLMAHKEQVPAEAVAALRAGKTPSDPKLGALSDVAREMVRGRGVVNEATLQRFFAAGYTREQVLDVVLGMGFSLLANYAGHLTSPALDAPLAAHVWQRAD